MNDRHSLGPQEQAFADDLRMFAQTLQPDTLFTDKLESQLALHKPRVPWADALLRQALIAAAAALVVVSVALLVSPPLRAMAQEVLDRLFIHAGSNAQIVEYAPWSPADLRSFSTLDAVAAAEWGFDVLVPGYLPEGYTFAEATTLDASRYMTLTYSPMLFIGQGIVEAGYREEVGASARIIEVPVQTPGGTVMGQYVQGAWVWDTPEGGMPHPSEGIRTGGEWRSTIPMRRLAWSQGGMLYEISVSQLGAPPAGANGAQEVPALPTMETLVRIAESLRPLSR